MDEARYGGLALRASGRVGCLVHDHRLREASYLPGDGGFCTWRQEAEDVDEDVDDVDAGGGWSYPEETCGWNSITTQQSNK